MDQESNQMEQHPVQCRNGCGFYSNAGTDGLCSVCYKETIKKKQQPPTNMPSTLTPAPGAMASLSIDESSSSPIKPAGNSLETASPTVILPSQTDKRHESSESESLLGGGAAAAGPSGLDDPSSPSSGAACSSSASSSAIAGVSESSPAATDADGQKEGGKKKKNRCLSCKKKVGLTGFTCRCGGLFCSMHRYSDKHECSFNYKEMGAKEIKQSNPVVMAQKIQKI